MALNGYVLKLDLPELHDAVRLMGSLSNNVNQIARRLNKRGSIFETEIDDIKDRQKELRTLLSSMYARILAFSNGDLVSLYDRSDSFFRRKIILTTKRKPPDRVDDPDISEKLCGELEGIFLWAFEGLQRLEKTAFGSRRATGLD